ncbi:MAG: hypothetical protein KC729_15295 [Candidatus Eisenbacteria bacterium]|uniref:Tetratricopeptide repeat protein n=1 Tax=Eiseniibacteriota bacterium TaxID=2212470 RepID=A0A956RQJ0_UNCEI|nr:hypothetical protein [Candidatus Eisenbacteria bacterium]
MLVLFLTSGVGASVRAEEPDAATLDAFRADPRSFFFEQRSADAIACGQIVLRDPDYPPAARVEALTTLGAIYVSTKRTSQARAAFYEILETDPLAELDRPEQLPPPVVRLYYGLRDSVLLAAGGGRPDIRTVAVGDIENNAIVSGAYDLDRFALGLQHILVTDLKASTPLKIVDRQRLGVLLDEIGMNQNQEVFDPRYSVPLGKLCGAQSYLFGSLFQVEEKKIRLDLKWVDTSTTEILLSEGLEMKIGSGDDLLKLERKVLLDLLLPKMHELLVSAQGEDAPTHDEMEKRVKQYFDEKKRAKKRLAEGANYVDLLLQTGDAILAEERGDLAEARTAWKRVREIDPLDPLAEDRSAALVAYLDLQEGP